MVVFQITLHFAQLCLVERRLGDVDMAMLDKFGHLSVKECQQQRPNMCAVNVGIRHDDDPVVAQFSDVVFVFSNARAKRLDQGDNFLG